MFIQIIVDEFEETVKIAKSDQFISNYMVLQQIILI